MSAVALNIYEYATHIPGFMMTNKRLTPLAKLAYSRLTAICCKDGSTKETFVQLAHEVGSSPKLVKSAVRELLDNKLIKVEEMDKAGVFCRFIWHESMSQEMELAS